MRNGKKVLSVIAALVFAIVAVSYAEETAVLPDGGGAESLLFMDLPTMMGSLTVSDSLKAPVAKTVITAKQIEMSPARNIYDLMETYVPGVMFTHHSEANHPAIRGIAGDRNTKILLLLNGQVINQKGHQGASDELENWDLNDIERIEVIRGPGSVTYGPGAIAGVINIITKDASKAKGLKFGSQTYSEYVSNGGHASYGTTIGDVSLYGFASYERTLGVSRNFIGVSNSNVTGITGSTPGSAPINKYLKDYKDEPQIKAHFSADFFKELKLWVRYNQAGASIDPGTTQVLDTMGNYVQFNQSRNRMFMASLEDNHKFSQDLSLKSTVSWRTQHRQRHIDKYVMSNYDDINNFRQDYAEDHLFIQSIATYNAFTWLKAALGAEYENEHYGAGWGRDPKDFVIGDNKNITIGTALGTNVTMGLPSASQRVTVGLDGWRTDTYSFLGEINMEIDPKLQILLSGRTDKNSYSKFLFSPRIALISAWDEIGVFKLVAQQSFRTNAAAQLLMERVKGNETSNEELKGIEMMWNREKDGLNLASSVFYNELNAVSFITSTNLTTNTGVLKTIGVEAEASYKTDSLTVGANHSFVKQLSWELAPGIANAGVSYSDYNFLTYTAGVAITLAGTGNDLNNWSNNATKIFAEYEVIKNVLNVHVDGHIFWDFLGMKDQVEMVKKAVEGTATEAAVLAVDDYLKSMNVYEPDLRINLSVKYQPFDFMSVTGFVINAVGLNRAQKYGYDAGVAVAAPARVRSYSEPSVVGVKLDFQL